MNYSILDRTLKQLLVPGKGILAADESVNTIGQRFEKLHVLNSEEKREEYRELLFTIPDLEKYISGVILFEETLQENGSDGAPLPNKLSQHGVVIGCKVDQGLAEAGDEFTTKGAEGLSDRLKKYYFLGARFAKWRAVVQISKVLPSERVLRKNAELLAIYAKACQEAGIIPIVEPEVLSTGGHTSEQCYSVTEKALGVVFAELERAGVDLRYMILKPNMIVPGSGSGEKMVPEKVGNMTVSVLMSAVPKNVPGIAFLSGGQTEQEACLNLNAIMQHENLPWLVTYSFGRALQNSTLATWAGDPANKKAAQIAFMKRAKLVSMAQQGKYDMKLEEY